MAQREIDQLDKDLSQLVSSGIIGDDLEEGLSQAVVLCAAVTEELCTGRDMACKAGCPHCCVLNVSVLLPEALLIAETIRRNWQEAERKSLLKRLSEHSSWVRWMDDEERIMRQAFCPLLDAAGNCSIHPVRPLVCRSVTTIDDLACRRAFDPVVDEQNDRSVPADLERRSLYDGAFISLAKALAENGLDDRSIELGTGILAFLNNVELKSLFFSRQKLPRQLWE